MQAEVDSSVTETEGNMGERFFGSIHIIDLFIGFDGDGELIKSPEDWFASFLRKHI